MSKILNQMQDPVVSIRKKLEQTSINKIVMEMTIIEKQFLWSKTGKTLQDGDGYTIIAKGCSCSCTWSMLNMTGKQEGLSPMLDTMKRKVGFEDTTDLLRRESFFAKDTSRNADVCRRRN